MKSRLCPTISSILLLLALGAAACDGDNLTVPSTGAIEVTTVTSGSEPDADGYMLQIDAGTAQPIGVGASIESTDLAPGDHTVQLSGVASHCAISGDNPRTVTIAAGATTTVEFAITCGASGGGLAVSVTTNGPATDADGFSVTLDGSDRGTLGGSGGISVPAVPAGDHLVGLSGVAANCQVEGDNPRTVTVTAGGNASVAFVVTCAAPPANAGTLRVTTASTGADLDRDGYSFALDGGSGQPIGVSASAELANVAAGPHAVKLTGLAPNCSVQGENPRTVTVSPGATAETGFAITCSTTTGSIKVTTTSSGPNPDPDGYTLALDGAAPVPIPNDGSHTFEQVAGGSHQIQLGGLAANCVAAGDNPRTVSLAAGGTATASFSVSCALVGLRWTQMSSDVPGNTELFDVHGGSSGNVFAAGNTLIPHFNGSAWASQQVTTGVGAVWVASANDAFAGGGSKFGNFLRYAGGQWSEMSPPMPDPAPTADDYETFVFAMWGSSSSNVFAVGERYLGGETWESLIAHYDGSSWSLMLPGKGYVDLFDVYGTSATDVYTVGQYQPHDSDPEEERSVVLHYDGSGWSEILREPDIALSHVWASSSSDVYATGRAWPNGLGNASVGAIWRFDGSRWAPMASPPTTALGAIWGTSATDVYVLAGPDIWHFDGGSWSKIYSATATLNGIWGSSATDVFAVGEQGTIVHGTP